VIENFIQGNVYPYQQRLKELDAENEILKEALLRARVHGVHSRGYHAFCAGDLAEWIDKGMTGPLPEITSPFVRADLAEVRP
jgi:hypothetical protein